MLYFRYFRLIYIANVGKITSFTFLVLDAKYALCSAYRHKRRDASSQNAVPLWYVQNRLSEVRDNREGTFASLYMPC
jgi:hypothetical protein